MPEAKFILKEPKSDKPTLVYLFYNFNNERLKYSTGEKILPRYWDFTKQKAKKTPQFPQHLEFNQKLKNIEMAIDTTYLRLVNSKVTITPELLKAEINKELEISPKGQINGLIEWIKAEVELMKQDKKHGSIQVYNALVKHLEGYSKKHKTKLTFDKIDFDFYDKFKDYMIKDKKLLTNTFGKQVKTLKTFLNLATDKGVNTNTTYKKSYFKSPQETVDHIYLTDEELNKLYSLNLSNKPYLDRVRDLFLMGCYTGLRFSDFTQLKKEHIKVIEGREYLNVITHKTSERVVIPMMPVVRLIWDKYNGELPRAISNQNMNVYLKELGELAGFNEMVIVKRTSGNEDRVTKKPKYQLISTHTARRSFATNAFLGKVPTISIMKITGHRTESSFMKYIKVSQERNAINLMEHPHFNQIPQLKAVS